MHASDFRRSQRADPFGRYDTASSVGEMLVSRVTVKNPASVLDLGAGHGALSLAAARKWQSARVVAIESDGARTANANHDTRIAAFRADALDPDLPRHIGIQLGSVSVAVCNPPFTRPRWRSEFAELLRAVGLTDCYSAFEEAGASVLFLAQNLRFLRTGGELGLIAPDGLISGHRHKEFRRRLLTLNTVMDVIELPVGTFTGTEVKSQLLVLRKGYKTCRPIKLWRFQSSSVGNFCLVSPADAIHRLDHSFHSQQRTTKHGCSLAHLVHILERGRTQSNRVAAYPKRVFHTTDLDGKRVIGGLPKSWRWTTVLAEKHKQILAWPGDLLVARVGRRLQEQVAVVRDGPIAISDCIYRLCPKPGQLNRIYSYLSSPEGSAALAARASGTGARHLSKIELLGMPIDVA